MLASAKSKPAKLVIRAYQVGFGDCFLLTFHYPTAKKKEDQERHVLIDFGSTGMPDGIDASDQMMRVAKDIEARCNGKLHMVVATHRHKDHISGFTTKDDGSGTGNVIKALNPDLVVQPWTEDPDAKDPKVTDNANKLPSTNGTNALANLQFVSSLGAMNSLAEAIHTEVTHLKSEDSSKALGFALSEQIRFLSDDNSVPNQSAVTNLEKMGDKQHYVNYGYKLNLSRLMPGVKVHVLGPPTLEQHAEIKKQRSRDKDEFWMLQGAVQSFWHLQSATGELIKNFASGDSLFPGADVYQDFFPSHDRWFIRQLRQLRGGQLLRLVRILDKSMNNTSVILLFEVGGKKFLFPGDAQIENWEYALQMEEAAKLLKDVCFYKVGHHGSRNATPKTLWKNFARKNSDDKHERLRTLNSTMKGKHGHEKSNTEVPRNTLVNEFERLSDYKTTEEAVDKNQLYVELEIPI